MPTKKAITTDHLRSLAARTEDCIAEVASAAAGAIEEAIRLLSEAMTGASATEAGAGGMVPGPAAGDQTKFLRGDGTWAPLFQVSTSDPPADNQMIWVKSQSLS